MSTKVNYMVLDDCIVVHFNTETHTIMKGTKEHEDVLNCILQDKVRDIPKVVTVGAKVEEALPNKEFTVKKGVVYDASGVRVHNYIGDRLQHFAKNQLPYKPLIAFWERLKQHPSIDAVDQLYRFLEATKCPLTDDGKFIAYKSVNRDFTDKHTGKFKYRLNKATTMPRDAVTCNPQLSCGAGLHVGSFSYASTMYNSSTSILLEVLVDPIDVVSVPYDHASGKLRACKLTPLSVCKGEYDTAIVSSDKGHKSDTVVSKPEQPSDSTTGVDLNNVQLRINRKDYTCRVVTKEEYDKIINQHDGVLRIRPAESPQSIQELGTVIETYLIAVVAIYCVQYKMDNTTVYTCMTDDANSASVPIKQEKIVDTLTLLGNTYSLKDITKQEAKTIMRKHNTIRVRASKHPASIKRMYSNRDEVFRIAERSNITFIIRIGSTYLYCAKD